MPAAKISELCRSKNLFFIIPPVWLAELADGLG